MSPKQGQATKFTIHLPKNQDIIHSLMGESSDFITRDLMVSPNHQASLFFLDGMVDQQMVQSSIIAPLIEYHDTVELTAHQLEGDILESSEVVRVPTIEESLQHILSGGVLLVVDKIDIGFVLAMPGWEDRSITPSSAQPIVRGPQNSFIESLRTNTTLVRRRVKDTRLRITTIQAGKLTKTNVAIMYLDGIADEKLVKQLTQQLESISEDRLLEGEYIEEILLSKKQPTIFPLLYNTDRPDTIAAGVLEGRIALFIDGTPFVLLAPSFFIDFLQSAEDYYQSFTYSSIIRILRYVSLFICMLAPAIYIALTTFHQDMLPTQLLLSLATQREGVPFPAFIEALLMEVTFEILREAGLRMPRTIGQAVSIVGTIVIGQAAVEASIVSAVMVIVVSITAISSFVIPAYSMSIAVRILRFFFMGVSAMFGIYGITIGLLLLVIHLAYLNPFGVAYMRPIAPYNKKAVRDAVLRFPYRN
jgi:spore germination protein KA